MLRSLLLTLFFGLLSACLNSNPRDSSTDVLAEKQLLSPDKKEQSDKKSASWLIKDTRFWTVFNTGYKANKDVGLRLSLPPGALVIKAPVVQLPLEQGFKEYELLSAGFNFSGSGPSEMHITFVLYDISRYKNLSLKKISRKLQVDRKLFFHNSHLSWFKNPGKETKINEDTWLHRIGRSTGPSTKSKLQLKSEDAYLTKLDSLYALAVYGTYYDSLEKNALLDQITRQVVENIKVTMF